MAYLFEHLVSRLCLYSTGGKQGVERKASPKSSHCMGIDRFLAWCRVDLPFVGNILCSAFDWRALHMGEDTGKTSQDSTTCLCVVFYLNWLVNFSSGGYKSALYIPYNFVWCGWYGCLGSSDDILFIGVSLGMDLWCDCVFTA